MVKKLFKAENIVCALFVPILIFIVTRMTAFFRNAWQIEINAAAGISCFAALFLCVIIFRKGLNDYCRGHAYGFTPQAIMIYVLALLTVIKYKNVFVGEGIQILTAVCILGAGLLLGAFVLVLMKDGEYILQAVMRTDFNKRDILVILIVLAVLNVQAVLYCKFMQKIFVWDNAGYFTLVHKLNNIFPSGEYFRGVYNSIFESDYNYIIAIPASIMCKLFGKSRIVFVLSIINFYVFPILVILRLASKKLFGGRGFFCALLFVPYTVFAANNGFIDIGGVALTLAATLIYLRGADIRGAVFCGVLLASAVLLRRWYSFFALSFIIVGILSSLRTRSIFRALLVLCGFAFTLLFFTQDFVTGKLMADYRGMYSAYSLGIRTDLLLTTRYFGIVSIAFVAAFAVCRSLKTSRKELCSEHFMCVQALLCFALFTFVQTHGQQHLSLYVPCLYILIMSLSMFASGRKKSVAVCLLCGAQTLSTFIPRTQPQSITEIKRFALFPSFSAYPTTDSDTGKILEIAEYLDSNIGMNGKTACVLSSSLKLNYETFRNVEVSLSVRKKYDIDRETYLLPISEVDKRDGLSNNLFDADYVVFPSTLQLHLSPDEQKTISVPYEFISSGTGFGAKYEKEDVSFSLADGTEIFIYRRTDDITREERDKIFRLIE